MPRIPDTSYWDSHLADDAAPWGHLPTVSAEETWWRLRGTGARRVLVAGCAYGRHVQYFARKGFEVAGIDASQIAIDRAHDASAADGLSVALAHASATRMPFSDGSFDAVYDHSLLHHLSAEDRGAAVREYRRVLRYGGLLVVSALSTDDPEFGIGPEIESGSYRGADGGLEHFFDEGELRDLLSDFDVESVLGIAEPAEWEGSGDPRRFLRVVARRRPTIYGPPRRVSSVLHHSPRRLHRGSADGSASEEERTRR